MKGARLMKPPAPRASTVADLRADLRRHADPGKAALLQRFFKTGPGEYGEGDIFIGVMVPQTRAVARRHREAPLPAVMELLRSAVHEERLLALLLFVDRYGRGDEKTKKEVYSAYLGNSRFINNWDLVDLSAPQIVGRHLEERDRSVLKKLAKSKRLWKRRIAVLATFWFIKNGDFADSLDIAGMLLDDREDLIHKAVGWMLREMGKRDAEAEEAFLRKHYRGMPRTMLRYAIERFPEAKRRAYLAGPV